MYIAGMVIIMFYMPDGRAADIYDRVASELTYHVRCLGKTSVKYRSPACIGSQ